MTDAAPAAYGLRLAGLSSARWLAVTGAGSWPLLTCTSGSSDSSPGRRGGRADTGPDAGPDAPPDATLDDDGATLRLRADIPHAELIHPLLGRVASRLALERGGDAMHAGAFATPTGAWAVIGRKLAGKSTLLAALARAGIPIVTDDVLVFAAGRALAGPRCIDLRPDAPGRGPGVAVRPGDPRHRIALAPIAAEHRLAGVVHLEWSPEESTLERVGHREAIRRLLAVQAEKGYPRDPGALLDIAALPTLVLRRPRTPAGLAASMALVSEAAGSTPERAGKIHRSAVVCRA